VLPVGSGLKASTGFAR